MSRFVELMTRMQQLHKTVKDYRESLELIYESVNSRYEAIGNIPRREYLALWITETISASKQYQDSPLVKIPGYTFVATSPKTSQFCPEPPNSPKFLEAAEARNIRLSPYHLFIDMLERLRDAILKGQLDKYLRNDLSTLIYESIAPHGKFQYLIGRTIQEKTTKKLQDIQGTQNPHTAAPLLLQQRRAR